MNRNVITPLDEIHICGIYTQSHTQGRKPTMHSLQDNAKQLNNIEIVKDSIMTDCFNQAHDCCTLKETP